MILKANFTVPAFTDLRNAEKERLLINFVSNYIHNIPKLPQFFGRDRNFGKYHYNLCSVSCDCGKFTLHKQLYNERDIRTCCYHLISGYLGNNVKNYIDDFTVILLEEQQKHGPSELYRIDAEKFLSYQAVSDWINVFALQKGEWRRFGFNLKTDRWSYSRAPESADYIKNLIDNMRAL